MGDCIGGILSDDQLHKYHYCHTDDITAQVSGEQKPLRTPLKVF
jgi:hypothetical protein